MSQENTSLRPPIIAVLGHVDHGKTSLLDAIRKTRVQERETGGITQAIGASVVKTKEGKEITFIDTPGHSAFNNMRSHGANASDIAILVVAADDGVKPQTKEAIDLIKKAQVPLVVAITKTDLPSSEPEKVKGQLAEEGIITEGFGGDVPCVSVSAKKGEGLENLLSTVDLVSQLNEIKGDKTAKLEAVVIETSKTNAGITASVVVKNGSIKVSDEITDGKNKIKVRGIFDDLGKKIDAVTCGYPAQLLGFDKFPEVGVVITNADGFVGTESKKIVAKEKMKEGQLAIFVKAKTLSSLEAVLKGLPEKVYIADSGVGDVTESDVISAKSSNAKIYTFETKAPNNIKKLADSEGVKIETFDIIYKLFERLDEILKKGQVEELGRAKIVAIFPYEGKKVAGSKVLSGSISKENPIIIQRDGKDLGKTKVSSMKKQKTDTPKVLAGEEFGLMIEPMIDFQVGDLVIAVDK